MLTSERRALILSRLQVEGRILAPVLAAEWGTSEDTIRRDLREMASEGLLRRVHGGALPIAPPLPDLHARRGLAADEKQRLGRAAAALIRPGETIFIDGGSTHLALIAAFPDDLTLTVVTHSPTIASALEPFKRIDIDLIGGRIYRHSMVATGAEALSQILRRRYDRFFLGVTGLHERFGLTTGDAEEAAIKRAIASQSAETIVLATTEKLGAASPITILPISGVTSVVIPSATDMAEQHFLRDAGVELVTGW